MNSPKDSASQIGYTIALSEKWGGFECTSDEINKLAAMIAEAIQRERSSLRSVEPAKIVLPRTDRFDPDESSLFLAGVLYTLHSLRRLNAGAAFKIEGGNYQPQHQPYTSDFDKDKIKELRETNKPTDQNEDE
jgi:hypothetical protein